MSLSTRCISKAYQNVFNPLWLLGISWEQAPRGLFFSFLAQAERKILWEQQIKISEFVNLAACNSLLTTGWLIFWGENNCMKITCCSMHGVWLYIFIHNKNHTGRDACKLGSKLWIFMGSDQKKEVYVSPPCSKRCFTHCEFGENCVKRNVGLLIALETISMKSAFFSNPFRANLFRAQS